MKRQRGKVGRPRMFEEEMQLIHLRVPRSLVEEVTTAQHALEKSSVAELVRDALRDYLDKHRTVIEAVRRVKEKHRAE
jgi:metal-responsive CopG/Arc/MetJ family transcriptional regulator